MASSGALTKRAVDIVTQQTKTNAPERNNFFFVRHLKEEAHGKLGHRCRNIQLSTRLPEDLKKDDEKVCVLDKRLFYGSVEDVIYMTKPYTAINSSRSESQLWKAERVSNLLEILTL